MTDSAKLRRLWYLQPASDWNEALPLGSGSLGMMVFGGTAHEILQLNEETLWSGYPAQWDNPDCLTHLDEMRWLLFQRRYRQAEALCNQYLVCRGAGSDDSYYGSYQTAGELHVEAAPVRTEGYVRSLDLDTGLAQTCFGPVRRRYVCSHRWQVSACCLEGQDVYTVSFRRENVTVRCRDGVLTAAGCNDGMDFCTLVRAETDGRVEPRDQTLRVEGCTYLTLWICTATTYSTPPRQPVARVPPAWHSSKGF